MCVKASSRLYAPHGTVGAVTVKALCLRQPWATWVVTGRKRLETRTWATRHRGPLLVVASRSGEGAPRGCAVGAVVVTGCRPMTGADERAACIRRYPRAKAWTLREPITIRPVPLKGRLGIFPVRLGPRFGPGLRRWFRARAVSRAGESGSGRRGGSRAADRTPR